MSYQFQLRNFKNIVLEEQLLYLSFIYLNGCNVELLVTFEDIYIYIHTAQYITFIERELKSPWRVKRAEGLIEPPVALFYDVFNKEYDKLLRYIIISLGVMYLILRVDAQAF